LIPFLLVRITMADVVPVFYCSSTFILFYMALSRRFVAICITCTKFKFFKEKMSGRGGKDTTTVENRHYIRKAHPRRARR
jgi:hypothetical protein